MVSWDMVSIGSGIIMTPVGHQAHTIINCGLLLTGPLETKCKLKYCKSHTINCIWIFYLQNTNYFVQGPFLLTWINFTPIIDK